MFHPESNASGGGHDVLDSLRRDLRMLGRHPALGPLASALDAVYPPKPVASQECILDAGQAVAMGSVTTPYLFRIMLGDNRASARADSTATAQFQAMVKILGPDVPDYEKLVPVADQHGFHFDKEPL